MAMASLSCFLTVNAVVFTFLFSNCYGQSISVADNAFDSLDLLGCSQFKAIIRGAEMERKYQSDQSLTLFVFNDTTYSLFGRILNFDSASNTVASLNRKADYVDTFTLSEALETSSFSASTPKRTNSIYGLVLFLNSRRLRTGNVASGQPGPTKYFCNGATIIRANIKAGRHVIHIIDNVLPLPVSSYVLAYISGRDQANNMQRYKFYTELMKYLDSESGEGEFTYNRQVHLPLQESQVTFFIPSDEAVLNIPSQKLSELKADKNRLLQIIALHIIPKQVIYTSLVNHNEGFVTQMDSGRILFRKNFDKEAVYVTGSIRGGETVTARLFPANVTVQNGVIHQVDRILGFVFRTALEEISADQVTNNFERLIASGRKSIQNNMASPSGVTIFAPTNNAVRAIANVYPDYINNQSLINRVLELSLLIPGNPFSLTNQNGGYQSLLEVETRHNGRRVKIYSEGNDTWVEGGYVRAKVIKPDIGVTNGLVHHIDAVFGVPTRDIVYTIFCEDRLIPTYIQMVFVGLDKYMRDPTLNKNQECSLRSGEEGGAAGVPNQPDTVYTSNDQSYLREVCGYGRYKCPFTFFVPNGTAIDNFALTPYGKDILNDQVRWRWLLRRLITTREIIYLDRLALNAPKPYVADNGEEVRVEVSGRGSGNVPSSQRTAYLTFEDARVEIIHSDIGATNGVIHIINNVLFTDDDLTRSVSGSIVPEVSIATFVLMLCTSFTLLRFI